MQSTMKNPITPNNSLQSTPRKSTESKTPKADTPTSSRKAPHCKTCLKPRQGHPRQGCPANTPTTAKVDEMLQNLNLAAMRLDEKTLTDAAARDAAEIRARRRQSTEPLAALPSLASLSSTSSDLVAKLLLPSVLDNVSEAENTQHTVNHHTVQPMVAAQIMRWQGKIQSGPANRIKPELASTPTPDRKKHLSTNPQKPSTHLRSAPRPLARTMSSMEREEFIKYLTLSKSPKSTPRPTLHVVSRHDLEALRERAKSLGFFTRAISRDTGKADMYYYNDDFLAGGSEESDDAWLILGIDEQPVQELFERVAKCMDNDSEQAKPQQAKSRILTVAGGAVVGAVATYTGLAFS